MTVLKSELEEGYLRKHELIKVHETLYWLKRLFENLGSTNEYYVQYDSLGFNPAKIYASREYHIRGVKLLYHGLMRSLNIATRCQE